MTPVRFIFFTERPDTGRGLDRDWQFSRYHWHHCRQVNESMSMTGVISPFRGFVCKLVKLSAVRTLPSKIVHRIWAGQAVLTPRLNASALGGSLKEVTLDSIPYRYCIYNERKSTSSFVFSFHIYIPSLHPRYTSRHAMICDDLIANWRMLFPEPGFWSGKKHPPGRPLLIFSFLLLNHSASARSSMI